MSNLRRPIKATAAATGAATLVAALTVILTAISGCALQSDVQESGEFFKKIFRKETYSLYRPDVQQGNTISADKLDRLELDMTKEQVRYLLGNPVADHVFHKNRWTYTYYLIPGKGERRRYQLVLFFSENRLYKIRRSKELAARGKELAARGKEPAAQAEKSVAKKKPRRGGREPGRAKSNKSKEQEE